MEGHFFVFLRFRIGAHHVLAIGDDELDNVTLYLMTTTHINGYLPYGMIYAILYLNLDFME